MLPEKYNIFITLIFDNRHLDKEVVESINSRSPLELSHVDAAIVTQYKAFECLTIVVDGILIHKKNKMFSFISL